MGRYSGIYGAYESKYSHRSKHLRSATVTPAAVTPTSGLIDARERASERGGGFRLRRFALQHGMPGVLRAACKLFFVTVGVKATLARFNKVSEPLTK